jgi:hypothetical protein
MCRDGFVHRSGQAGMPQRTPRITLVLITTCSLVFIKVPPAVSLYGSESFQALA